MSSLLHHPGILRVLPPERLDGCLVLPLERTDGGNRTKQRGNGYLQVVVVLLQAVGALVYGTSAARYASISRRATYCASLPVGLRLLTSVFR